ncbi:MAG: hypothetical protein IIT58_04285 [Treponema sp.]|nr:hypothetical protein [Treponema sp.]
MKKTIYSLITLFALGITALFSSCMVFLDEYEEWDDYGTCYETGSSGGTSGGTSYSSTKHDFTFYNNTSYDVTDWFLQDQNGKNYALSENSLCPVYRYSKSTKTGLKEKTYTVYFAYESRPEETDYWTSEYYFELDKNVVYYLKSDTYNTRGLGSEPVFSLVDSDGNVIPLKKVSK